MNISTLLIIAMFASGGEVAIQDDRRVLRIRQPGETDRPYGCYGKGDRVPIQLEVSNEGDDTALVTIVDHDEQGSREAHPNGLLLRVTDGKGQVLTAHDIGISGQSEWWTSQYLSSQVALPELERLPGNRISLKPGQLVRRVYDVAKVAGGCNSCPVELSIFPPGTYFLEVRFDRLKSNQYKIVVLREGECCE